MLSLVGHDGGTARQRGPGTMPPYWGHALLEVVMALYCISYTTDYHGLKPVAIVVRARNADHARTKALTHAIQRYHCADVELEVTRLALG